MSNPNFISGLADIEAANGTIQGIDRVLIPLDIPGNEPALPTIAGIVAQSEGTFDDNNQDFDILLTALQTADLVTALDDSNADFTVFAPTDAAFVRLAQDFGYTGTNEAEAFDAIVNTLTDLSDGNPVSLLGDILRYHVSLGAQSQVELKAQGQVDTLLEGASFKVAGELLVDQEPDLINPRFERSLADVQAGNGRIQGINRVLIPLDIPNNDKVVKTGNAGNNFLFGLNRSVKLQGRSGNDRLLGSRRNDQLRGGRGNDFLFGRSGNDLMRGGRGRDKLFGGRGDNFLQGGSGNDVLFGDGGNDILLGGKGRDTIISRSHESFVDGGAGNDFIFLHGQATVALNQGQGVDTLQGFTAGQTTFSLGSGLAFDDLSFQQGNAFSTIAVGDEVLARVVGVTAETLNSEANFA